VIGSLRKAAARLLRIEPAGYPTNRPVRTTSLDSVPCIRDAYPGVRSLTISLTSASPDRDFITLNQSRRFGPEARAWFAFKCKNSDCQHGGFSLNRVIDEMIAAKVGHYSSREVCDGTENTHGARGVHGRLCMYELNYDIHVEYREN
jgi:hypothetical protein